MEVTQTETFAEWHQGLADERAKARIAVRIDRLAAGNWGDWKSVGDGIRELRIDYGPGYRLYVKLTGKEIVILLCGGSKASQNADIKTAKELAK